MLIRVNVVRRAHQHKSNVRPAFIADRKLLAMNARHFMFLGVALAVSYTVDACIRDHISGFEHIADMSHRQALIGWGKERSSQRL